MTRKISEFHGILADMLISAKRQYDGRPASGEPGYLSQASQNAVTVWRRTAHLVDGYANGAARRGVRPGWGALWDDGKDRAAFLRLVKKRSWFNRCGENGEAPLYEDSVSYWEFELARAVMDTASLVTVVRKGGSPETIRRIELEHEVTVHVAVAYTGVSLADFRRTVNKHAGWGIDGPKGRGSERGYPLHPMLELITTNRPIA